MGKLSNNRKVIVIVASILIIIGLVGITYAFFTGIVKGNEETKGTVVETGKLSIKYTNSNELRGDNIVPGWSETKTFTVENTGTVKAKYNINWNNLVNEFINKEDLVYTISSDNNGGTLTETILPESGEDINIISNISIEPNVIQTYNLTVSYKNRDADQTSDAGKKLIGKIEVKDINGTPGEIASDLIISKYSENNTEGLIKIAQPTTVQTKETTEYRYSGSNDVVKNYATFNGENWRIIGVFDVDDGTGKLEKRIKMIREESIGNYSWDSSAYGVNSSYGSNQWGPSGSYLGADLMRELNDTYYNSKNGTCYSSNNNGSTTCNFTTIGLKEETRNMIDNAKWYTGASGYNIITSAAYSNERSNKVGTADSGQSITKTSNWIGKIAVMYPSDYGYASNTCYSSKPLYSSSGSSYDYRSCTSTNWLYESSLNQWALTPYEASSNRALVVDSAGYVGSNNTYNPYAPRPTLYLKPDVQITKGTGTSSDRYEFGM